MKFSKRVLLVTPVFLFFSFSALAQANSDTTTVNQSTTTTTTTNTTTTQSNNSAVVKKDDKPDLRHVEFGVRYMPTFSSVDFNTYDNGVVQGEFVLSHGFGIMTAINFNKHVGIQAEVNYYQSTQQYKDRNFTNDVTINYLNIPVLLSLNTNKEAPVNLNLVAGPQFGLNVGSKFESSGSDGADTVKAVVGLRKGDIGFAYGAGLEFALNRNHTVRLDIGYRGFFGLVNMDSSENEDGTYNVIVSASRKTYGGYAGLTWLF